MGGKSINPLINVFMYNPVPPTNIGVKLLALVFFIISGVITIIAASVSTFTNLENTEQKQVIKTEKNKKDLNQEMFTNKDGYVEGRIEIETTNPTEAQDAEVQGQGKILKEKKRTAKWY